MRSLLFVSHSVFSVRDYCNSNRLISLKLGAMIGPTSGSGPGYGFQITFRLPSPLRNKVFRIFVSISYTVTGRFSRQSATTQHFDSDPANIQIQIRINPEIPDHFRLRLDSLAEVCALWVQSQSSLSLCIYLHTLSVCICLCLKRWCLWLIFIIMLCRTVDKRGMCRGHFVCLSVRLSVTFVICVKTSWHTHKTHYKTVIQKKRCITFYVVFVSVWSRDLQVLRGFFRRSPPTESYRC